MFCIWRNDKQVQTSWCVSRRNGFTWTRFKLCESFLVNIAVLQRIGQLLLLWSLLICAKSTRASCQQKLASFATKSTFQKRFRVKLASSFGIPSTLDVHEKLCISATLVVKNGINGPEGDPFWRQAERWTGNNYAIVSFTPRDFHLTQLLGRQVLILNYDMCLTLGFHLFV